MFVGMFRKTTSHAVYNRTLSSISDRVKRFYFSITSKSNSHNCRSQWPRVLRRRSAAARLLRLWVRIPPEARMSVSCGCCVLSGRGLCDELITRQEESYRLWRVVVCDLETLWMRRPWPTGGCCAKHKQTNKQTNITPNSSIQKPTFWLKTSQYNDYVTGCMTPDSYFHFRQGQEILFLQPPSPHTHTCPVDLHRVGFTLKRFS